MKANEIVQLERVQFHSAVNLLIGTETSLTSMKCSRLEMDKDFLYVTYKGQESIVPVAAVMIAFPKQEERKENEQ